MDTVGAIEKFRSAGNGGGSGKPKTADEIRAQIAELEKHLRAQEEAEARAAQAGNARRAIALLAAMRAAYKEIEATFPGTFEGEKWAGAAIAQAWPRVGRFKRAADLSETEVAKAQEIGEAAVIGLKV